MDEGSDVDVSYQSRESRITSVESFESDSYESGVTDDHSSDDDFEAEQLPCSSTTPTKR
jgi:hypothetical protein